MLSQALSGEQFDVYCEIVAIVKMILCDDTSARSPTVALSDCMSGVILLVKSRWILTVLASPCRSRRELSRLLLPAVLDYW